MAQEPNSQADSHSDSTPPSSRSGDSARKESVDSISAWAEKSGIRVVHRGRISPEIVEAYMAERDANPDS
jgi:hypothetical protein